MALPSGAFRRQRVGQSLIQSECLLCARLLAVSRDPKLLSLVERLHSCFDMPKSSLRAEIPDAQPRQRA